MTDFPSAFGTLRTSGFELTANGGPPLAGRTSPDIEAELRHHGSTPEGMRELARLAGVEGIASESVIDHVLEELARGRIVVEPRRALPMLCAPLEAHEVDLSDLVVLEPSVETFAVELQLVDQDDAPVSGAEYRLRLPDGSVRIGTLDERGFAREDGLHSADPCEVSFPQFDGQSWSYVHACPL